MLSEFCQFLSNFSPFLFVLVLNSRKFICTFRDFHFVLLIAESFLALNF